MVRVAKRFSILSLALAGVTGCATESEVPTTNELVGTWVVESAKLASLEPGTETMITAPVTVYPDREARAPYLSRPGTVGIKFSSTVAFNADGALVMDRDIELDGQKIGESTVGTWSLEDGNLIFEDPVSKFHVIFSASLWSHDELHLLAERDNPEFSDNSCIYEMTLKRK